MQFLSRGTPWKFRWDRRLKKHWGTCDHDGRVIAVHPDHRTEQDLLDTVIHEFLHSAFPDVQEDVIREVATDQAALLYALGWRRDAP